MGNVHTQSTPNSFPSRGAVGEELQNFTETYDYWFSPETCFSFLSSIKKYDTPMTAINSTAINITFAGIIIFFY